MHLILVPHKLAASCGWALGDSSHSPKTRDIKGGMAAWWFPLFYSMVRVWFGAADWPVLVAAQPVRQYNTREPRTGHAAVALSS